MGSLVEAMDDMHVGRCRNTSGVRGDTLMTPDNTAIQVRSSGLGRVGIGRSSGAGHNTGRHEKAPVRCPYGRLPAFHYSAVDVSEIR